MTLTIAEYQEGTGKTAVYRDKILITARPLIDNWQAMSYVTLKLNGEAGEVAEHVGKIMRDDGYVVTDDRTAKLFKEIGDVCWYVSQLCTELGFKLEDVMDYNLTKLADRQERGVLQGSGSDR